MGDGSYSLQPMVWHVLLALSHVVILRHFAHYVSHTHFWLPSLLGLSEHTQTVPSTHANCSSEQFKAVGWWADPHGMLDSTTRRKVFYTVGPKNAGV